ncbi:hypothetical protein AB0I10_07140 [Streptomyces sp. NPDC050636]|uniref:hypothetical protein n=1 Tax=Streptomyces sp. NPDC050636 TaxID=3154510 RepID=UPI00344A4938
MSHAFSPVPELNLLKEFEDRLDDLYADGFDLSEYGRNGFLEDPELIHRLIPFAQANGSGSLYALWRLDDRPDLATLPIVVLGDEGGIHLVARDLPELFQIIGYDSEIWVDWEDAGFGRDDDYEPSACHEEYVSWLKEHFGLAPADHPNAVMEAAQAEFGERFLSWVAPLIPDAVPDE